MIKARREATERREALISKEVAALSLEAAAGAPGTAGADGSAAAGGGGGGGTGGPPAASGGSITVGGPVQMGVTNPELVADIERLIRATRCSSGQQVWATLHGWQGVKTTVCIWRGCIQTEMRVGKRYRVGLHDPHSPLSFKVTIIKQGYLSKRSQGKKSDWKRRFFVLDSNGMYYYYSHKVRWAAWRAVVHYQQGGQWQGSSH